MRKRASIGLYALAVFALPIRGDLSYDLRETQTAHPILGMQTKEYVARVMIKSGMVAIRMNDMVQVANFGLNLVTLIDYRTKTFATSNIDEVVREDDQGFDSIEAGIRSQLVTSSQPAVWHGVHVKRDIARTVIVGGPAPGEILVTSDWTEDVPDLAEQREALGSGDQRHAQELETEIQTLIFAHPERFADSLKIRKEAGGHDSFQVHSLAEMRLAADAPLLEAVGPEYRARPILSQETEVMNLSAGDVDPGVFLAPADFAPVEFKDLLAEKYKRRHY